MTEAEEQQQYFETARGLMELATGAGDDDRGPLERCAVKYFWKACGMAGLELGGSTPPHVEGWVDGL